MDLTPDQFYKQWLRLGPAAATVSHFERQVFDFTHLGELNKITDNKFTTTYKSRS